MATPRSTKGFDADPLKSYGYQTRATHRAFDRVLQRQIGKHDLSNGFWYLLRVLWGREGMSQRELADEANLTESTTVLMLNAMSRAGLVRQRQAAQQRLPDGQGEAHEAEAVALRRARQRDRDPRRRCAGSGNVPTRRAANARQPQRPRRERAVIDSKRIPPNQTATS